MSASHVRNLESPDEVITMPLLDGTVVELGDLTVARTVLQPGWTWKTHVQPTVGTDMCEARHVGVLLAGRLEVKLRDGTLMDLGPDDVYEIPPGHDGWVVGDVAAITLEWSGVRAFTGSLGARRVLATLLFTDLVGSTDHVRRLGDHEWREVLSQHYEAMRSLLERHRGREVDTTGDGLLATFEGPAHALRCAAAIRDASDADRLAIRAGVHVGEVEVVDANVRGVAVHEAARIMGHAAAGEILVSETIRVLANGFDFEDRGPYELKGFPGQWRLHAYVGQAATAPTA